MACAVGLTVMGIAAIETAQPGYGEAQLRWLVISLLVAGLPLAPAMALLVTAPIMSPSAPVAAARATSPSGEVCTARVTI